MPSGQWNSEKGHKNRKTPKIYMGTIWHNIITYKICILHILYTPCIYTINLQIQYNTSYIVYLIHIIYLHTYIYIYYKDISFTPASSMNKNPEVLL